MPLQRVSTVDAVAAAIRARILEGELPAGARLVEQELCTAYQVARHSVRAALRALAAEGLVRIDPNRGARVTVLSPDDMLGVYELRTALEVEAARLALERHDGVLPPAVHQAVARLSAVCARPDPSWRSTMDAHDAVHRAIVDASASRRIRAAHAALAVEQRLFLMGIRPDWPPQRMADDHVALVAGLEHRGPAALRDHLTEAAHALGVVPAPRPAAR